MFASMVFNQETIKNFSTQTIISGVLMLIVGAVGIFAPTIMSLVVVVFLSWLFLISSIIQGYITYKTYRKSFSAWLKPVLLFIIGILFFIFPIQGIATVGLLLSVYLLLDAYSNFGFAMDYRPNNSWWILIINSLVSIVLALLILVGWPISSVFLVGFYAAVSLFFDGVALVILGIGAKKIIKNNKKDE